MTVARLLRCGALIDGAASAPAYDMAVRVEDGWIADVRPWHAVGDGALPVVDLSQHTVCPGFIDTHVHLLFTHRDDHAATRAAVETSSTESLAVTGLRAAVEALLGGVTTVRDCGDSRFVTLAVRDAIDSGTFPGPRVLAAGPPITTTGGHLHWCGNTADSVDEIRKAVRTLCARGVDLVKVMASGGNMTAGSNHLQPQFGVDELRVVVGEAHRLGRQVAAHASNTESIRRAVAAEVDSVEHCLWRGPSGGLDYDAEVAAEMARRPVWVGLTMAGIARVLLPEVASASTHRDGALALSTTGNLRDDHEWARAMRVTGVPMMLSSDAGVRFTPFRDFPLSLRCAVEALGVTLPEAISLASGEPARALGIDDQVGTVEAGKRADLVVLDGVVDAGATEVPAVRQVWRDGSLLAADGRLVVAAP